MKTMTNRRSVDVPTGWGDVLVSALKVAVVAFIILQLKEWYDAGVFDTLATATDAILIACGIFVVNAVIKLRNSQ